MRWCVSIGAALIATAIAGGHPAVAAAPDSKSEQADTKPTAVSVDVELVIAVDVSYSMDLDELAVQREGYAQAIASKEFLQALKTGPNGKVAVTYFEWSASNDQKIIIPWRLIDGPFKEAIRTNLLLDVAGRIPEPKAVPPAEKEPRVSCLISEKLWQDRWGAPAPPSKSNL